MAKQLAVIFIGPPGSGKTTQASELVRRFDGFVHFDLGRHVEQIVHDPANADDPVIQTERKRFDSGLLTSTQWVLGVQSEAVRMIAAESKSVVLSGSIRVREEAEFLVPFFRELYGEDRVIVFYLRLSPEVSIFRNTHRRICQSCKTPVVWSKENEAQAYCTICGGKLVSRSLDTPEAIEVRLHEYEKKTEPILVYFESVGVPIYQIDGKQSPEAIANEVAGVIKEKRA